MIGDPNCDYKYEIALYQSCIGKDRAMIPRTHALSMNSAQKKISLQVSSVLTVSKQCQHIPRIREVIHCITPRKENWRNRRTSDLLKQQQNMSFYNESSNSESNQCDSTRSLVTCSYRHWDIEDVERGAELSFSGPLRGPPSRPPRGPCIIVKFCFQTTKFWFQTDGRTDGRTDGQTDRRNKHILGLPS